MVAPIRLEAGAIPSQFRISEQQPDARILRLEPGQLITGRAIQGEENGVTRLLWSGHTFDLKLPEAVSPGTQIQLKVVSTEGAIQLQYIGQGLQPLGAEGWARPGVEVSSMSQWLASLMQAFPIEPIHEDGGYSSSVANPDIRSLEPLNPEKTQPSADVLAQQLQKTIEKSGLFYEAHQAQWVQGHKTVEALLDEPQARWSPAAGGSPPASNERNLVGIPHALVQHVEHQLGILENQTVQWQGEVWPGVKMSWYLHPLDPEALEDDEQRGRAETDVEQQPWSTQFDVNLPELGTVRARFYIYRDYVNWHLEADKESTQSLLGQHQSEWLSALQARGINAVGSIVPIEDE